jgi:hypothetical protein
VAEVDLAQAAGAAAGPARRAVDWPHASSAEIGVLGVEADDVLNVRARPGAGEPIVDRLEPLSRGLAFTGAARRVNVAYGLADGYRITWGPDPDPDLAAEEQRRIVISDGPRAGDLGEITLDVIDLFDDAIGAERLAIFAHPLVGEGFSLKTVERTFFCHRGGGDLCV